MKASIFFRQLRRSKARPLLYLSILVVTTAFIVVSLNLYVNSVKNLEYADNTYSTIALMELWGNVNNRGELATADDSRFVGYMSVAVEGYDLTDILNADGVTGYDLRAKYGAYIAGQPALEPLTEGELTTTDSSVQWVKLQYTEDILRFTLDSKEPIVISIDWEELSGVNTSDILLSVQETAAECFHYTNSTFSVFDTIGFFAALQARELYSEQVRQLNRSDETDYVILYPGVEYLVATRSSAEWLAGKTTGELQRAGGILMPSLLDCFGQAFHLSYGKSGESIGRDITTREETPFPIVRVEDLENDPELRALWDSAWEAVKYNLCSYTVCLTDDITGIPAMHLGGSYLLEGRMITDEEYESGAKVCMVSREQAKLQGWKVGDRLDMRFFQFEAFPNDDNDIQPKYTRNPEGFFDSGEYEIVGIIDQVNLAGNSGIAESTLSMPWNQIYVPKNSVSNTVSEEKLPVHGALLTIWLENGSIDDFLADMDALGLTEEQEGRYNPSFTFYDQGYSIIQPSLQTMYSTARLLLCLSAALLVCTCVLLAWFFAQSQKHSVGIFRMLGGRRWQALLSVFLCAALIAALGAVPGAAIGHALSTRVGEALLTGSLEESGRTAALRANVLAADTDTAAFAVEADARLSALSGTAVLLFPLLVLVIVIGYIGREPRALLPKRNT